jgi:hypothetical protein
MAFLFGDGGDPVHEVEGCHEIGKGVGFRKVVVVDNLPAGDLRLKFRDLFVAERGNAAATRHATFFGELHEVLRF